MKKVLWAVVCSLAITLQSYGQNLVTNGGFEQGSTGWSFQGGNSVETDPAFAHSGNNYVEGAAVGSVANVSQHLTTVPGTQYRIIFYLANPNGDTGTRAQVRFDQNIVFDQFPIPQQGYVGYTMLATTADSNTQIRIGLRDDPAAINLDDVYVLPLFQTAPNLTPNEHTIAANLDSFSALNGAGVDLLAAVGNTPNTAEALDELSPQKLQVFSTVAFNDFAFATQEFDNHMTARRNGSSGFDSSGLTVSNSSVDPSLASIRGKLLAWNPSTTTDTISDIASPILGGVQMSDSKDMKQMAAVSPNQQWSTYIDGNVVLGDVGSSPGLSHSNFTTGGVTAGADYRLNENWVVGGLFSYDHTDVDLDNIGSKGTVNSYSPGIYAGYSDGGYYANGLFSYARNDQESNRTISLPAFNQTAHGDTGGNQFNVDADGGYEFHSGRWTYGPNLGLTYVNYGVDSFTESGAGPANLAVNSQSAESLRSRLGGEVQYKTTWWNKVGADLHLSAYWQHEYLDDSRGITSSFSGFGTGTFTVQTTDPDRDSALLDFGLNTNWTDYLGTFVDYQAQAGQDNFFGQSVQAGVKLSF